MTRYTGHLLAASRTLLQLIFLGLIVTGCGNRIPVTQASGETGDAPNAINDSVLYREIRGAEPDNSCICNSTKAVNYFLANPDEFKGCTSLNIFNHETDCDLFKRLLKMEHLKVLSFGNYICDAVPEEIRAAKHLTALGLRLQPSWNQVPKILFELENLTRLSIGGDNLSTFENEIPIHARLESLDFYESPMEEVPMSFAKFPNLKYLNIGTPEHPIKNVEAFRALRPDISFSSNEFD